MAVLAIQRLLVQSHAHVEHKIDLKLCLIECDWLPKVHVASGEYSPGALRDTTNNYMFYDWNQNVNMCKQE